MSPLQPSRFFEIFGAFDDGSLLLKEGEGQEFALKPDSGSREAFVLVDRDAFDISKHGRIVMIREVFAELFGEPEKPDKIQSSVVISESARVSEAVARLIARYIQLKQRCAMYRDAIAEKSDSASAGRFQRLLTELEKEMNDVAVALRRKVEVLDEFKFDRA